MICVAKALGRVGDIGLLMRRENGDFDCRDVPPIYIKHLIPSFLGWQDFVESIRKSGSREYGSLL